jgi:hypothetical protein
MTVNTEIRLVTAAELDAVNGGWLWVPVLFLTTYGAVSLGQDIARIIRNHRGPEVLVPDISQVL